MAIIVASAFSAGARQRPRVEKARLRFLATSTILRGTWGNNEDTYLAELLSSDGKDPVLTRLVDAYPNEAPPLSQAILTSDQGTIVTVRRDAACDLPYDELLLRTAPGDPSAILPERLGYTPQLDHAPEPGAILPCYRTVRR